MRAYLGLYVTAVIAAVVSAAPNCGSGSHIDSRCYWNHNTTIPGGPWSLLDIDRNRNIVYLRNEDILLQCSLDADPQLAAENRCSTRDTEWHIRWLTVDQSTGDTYGKIFNGDGLSLYKLNFDTNDRELLVHGGVYYVTFKDKLYYSTYDKGIYTFEDGEPRLVPGSENYSVNNFVVDVNGDIYFKHYDNDQYVILRLRDGVVDRAEYWPNYLITEDKDGFVMFIDQDSRMIYRVVDGAPVEVGAINDDIYHAGLFETPLFDKNNNIVYRDNSRSTYNHMRIVNLVPY